MAAWAAALVTGLLFTEVEWFSGPLTASWIGRHGLGWAATVLVAAGVYAALPRPADGTGGEPDRF